MLGVIILLRKKEVAEEEYERASREHGRVEGEHIDETGVSRGAKRQGLGKKTVTCCPSVRGINIYIYLISLGTSGLIFYNVKFRELLRNIIYCETTRTEAKVSRRLRGSS